jgi:WhiB family redox-sensing transcriptional regulator
MAEVSWLSDYVSTSDRSERYPDRYRAERRVVDAQADFASGWNEAYGSGYGTGYGSQQSTGYGPTASGAGAAGGIAGLLGIGSDADAQSWQEKALCAETDPEAFFPEKGGSTREAKKICTGCEVKAECLEYALANDERFGIWGGLSERERRRLRRRAM